MLIGDDFLLYILLFSLEFFIFGISTLHPFYIRLIISIYTRTKSERQLLWENIQQNVANVRFTAPIHRNKTMLIHSMEAQHEPVGEVTSNGNLRKAIKQA